MSKDPKDGTRTDATADRVDLGEDLLKKSPARKGARSTRKEDVDSGPIPTDADEIADQFQSAKILRNEGLVEEAKKVLRRILIADPRYKPARVALEEIHEAELKQIFGTGDPPRRFLTGGLRSREKIEGINAGEVARKLDDDFQLGLFNEEGIEVAPRSVSLFDSARELKAFGDKLEADLRDLSADDRLDVGIAFLEMELYELAARQFEAVLRLRSAGEVEAGQFLNAIQLLGQCHLQAGRPYEAISALQPGMTESEATKAEKVGMYYLMGRAYEALRKLDDAAKWYREARAVDPRYRDVDERLRAVTQQAAATAKPKKPR